MNAMRKRSAERKSEVITTLRKADILDAAVRVFGKLGFDGAKVDDIAAEAQLARATVYAYFTSKDEIYVAVVTQVSEELSALTQKAMESARTLEERLNAFLFVRLAYSRERFFLYSVMLSINADWRRKKRNLFWLQATVNYLTELFESAAKRGEIPQQNFELRAWAVMDLLRGVYERRSVEKKASSAEEEASWLTQFVLSGLKGKPSATP